MDFYVIAPNKKRSMFFKQVLALLLTIATSSVFAQLAIGDWQDHFPYNSAIAIVEGNGKVYAATEFGITAYDLQDNSISRLTKINALSDAGISAMNWSGSLNALIVGYSNGNLDVVKDGRTVNIADIERSGILGDKAINDIYLDGDLAYLSCGFGIVVMDLYREEVKDTYMIGSEGAQLRVYDLTFFQDTIYAATDEGLLTAWTGSPVLSNFNSWSKRSDIPNSNGPFNLAHEFQGRLLVNFKNLDQEFSDTTYIWHNNNWTMFTSSLYNENRHLDSRTGNELTMSSRNKFQVFNSNLDLIDMRENYLTPWAEPWQTIKGSDGSYWVADGQNGLLSFSNNIDIHLPNGPATRECRRMDVVEGKVWVASGSVRGNWSNEYLKKGVHIRNGGTWSTINNDNDPNLDQGWNTFAGGSNDLVVVAINPTDPSQVFVGSWEEGLIEFRNEQFHQFHTPSTSTLQADVFYPDVEKVNVAGLAFDAGGNLWITNSHVEKPISVRRPNNTWRSFDPGAILQNNTLLGDIIVTQSGLKWMVRPRGKGILVFKDNNTITNTNDDEYKVLNTSEGTGNLPSIDVYAIAEDLDGEVWVGTGEGVAVFYNPDAVFLGGNYDAQQVLFEQDGNIQILLETEVVTAVAIDGANRKWFGTLGGGVFLMSPDGTEQIHHFDIDNSPLLSNSINDIAIDHGTGEVYFCTEKGILSYKGDATGGELDATCASVYPNPVRENYRGPIAITGLARDSDVKITDISGNLVYRTQSQGGQALWYGNNMEGSRVGTGVYLAFSADREGELTCVTKILFIK